MHLLAKIFASPLILWPLVAWQIGCSRGSYVGPESAHYLATAAEDDCGYIQNEFGQRVSWKTRIPVEIFVSKTVPAEFHQDIVEASEIWNSAAGKKILNVNLSQPDTSDFSSIDLKNTINGYTEWEDSKSSQQGVTVVKYRGALITESDIKVNFKDFVFYSKEAQNSKQVHFGSLLVHELGHALGLKHGLVRPTVMWSTLSSILIRTKLSAADTTALGCEY